MFNADVLGNVFRLVHVDRPQPWDRHVVIDVFPSPAGERREEMDVNAIPRVGVIPTYVVAGLTSPDGVNPDPLMIAFNTRPTLPRSRLSVRSSRDMFG